MISHHHKDNSCFNQNKLQDVYIVNHTSALDTTKFFKNRAYLPELSIIEGPKDSTCQVGSRNRPRLGNSLVDLTDEYD